MRKLIYLSILLGYCITPNLFANPVDSSMQNNSQMRGMMGMSEVTESDLLSLFNDQEKVIYQQLNAEQKALVIKAANHFSCRSQMEKMRKKMEEIMNP